MLPISIFVLVLLGGFVFVTKWYPTRYYTLRSDGYRLIFAALISGVTFLFISAFLTAFFDYKYPEAMSGVRSGWHWIVPAANSGKAAAAFLFGCMAWWPLNLLGNVFHDLSDRAAVDRAIERKSDALEVFLRKALGSGSMISISTKSGKVYVGKLVVLFNPAFSMDTISLLTIYSGHRDNDTKKLEIDVDYDQEYQSYTQELKGQWDKDIDDFILRSPDNVDIDSLYEELNMVYERWEKPRRETIIPVSEIQSVHYFEKKIYDKYKERFEADAV
jgi:hypothetical protein